MMRRLRSWLSGWAFVVPILLTSGAFLLAAGEVYLQKQYGAVAPGPPSDWNAYHAQRGWTLKPGNYFYFEASSRRRVHVAINDLGLRNAPLSRDPRPGVERITILGDSFVFGELLDVRETMTGQLQSLAGDAFEVVNVSAPGYGTGQQYRLIEELRAKNYELGRKVVLMFFANDIQDNLALDQSSLERNPGQPSFSIDQAGNLRQSVPRLPQGESGEQRTPLERSLLLALLRGRLEGAVASYPVLLGLGEAIGMKFTASRTPDVIAGWYGAQWEQMWRVTAGVLEHLVHSIRATPGAPELYLAFVPSPIQVHESLRRAIESRAGSDVRYASFLTDPDRPQRQLQALAERLDVSFIDLTDQSRRSLLHSATPFAVNGSFDGTICELAAKVIFQHAIESAPARSLATAQLVRHP